MDVARSDTVGHDLSVDPVSTDPGHRARPHRPLGRELLLLIGIALALTLVVRLFIGQAFYIPSGSMQPTLDVGDRVLVSRLAYRFADVQRGDVLVFDGRGSFAPVEPTTAARLPEQLARAIGAPLGIAPSTRDYVKRVIGLPGDRVRCCAAGRIEVNGAPIDERYVMPGDAASGTPFEVIVPAGRLWVMGDHRSNSADSRAHLGDPGGGTVPVDRVVGKVELRFWPLRDLGRLPLSAAGEPR